MTCGTTDCPNDKHKFNDPHRDMLKLGQGRNHKKAGVCKACGIDVVDWARVHRKDPEDVEHTVQALRREYIRIEFWERPLNDACMAQIRELGKGGVLASIRGTLQEIVGPPYLGHWDGMKVPVDDAKVTSIIQYAQHAMATCCRKCVWQWHDIAMDHTLTQNEVDYLTQITAVFVRRRLDEVT
jgi:hypothetical protein